LPHATVGSGILPKKHRFLSRPGVPACLNRSDPLQNANPRRAEWQFAAMPDKLRLFAFAKNFSVR
jgi:hypothetical protein